MALGAFGIFLFGSWLFFVGDANPEKAQKKYKSKLGKKFNGKDSVTWVWDSPQTACRIKTNSSMMRKPTGTTSTTSPHKVKYAQTLVFKRQSNINLLDRVAPYLDEN